MVNDTTPVQRQRRLCPCGKTHRSALQRIHRSWYMRTFLFWLNFKRYKCDNCKHNKWLFN